jgi:hypothetical protein
MSAMFGYTKMYSAFELSVTPDDLNTSANGNFSNQELLMDFHSFTGNLLLSVNLPVVTIYGGAGFSTTTTNLQLNGTYPMVENGVVVAQKDPFGGKIEIKNQDGGTTKPRLNGGIKFTFGLVTLHFDYTKANYDVATAGLGISLR